MIYGETVYASPRVMNEVVELLNTTQFRGSLSWEIVDNIPRVFIDSFKADMSSSDCIDSIDAIKRLIMVLQTYEYRAEESH